MNVLSLFDGMSCGQIALNKAGIKYDSYYASEIDEHAIKVTKHNYPNTLHIGSITELNTNTLPTIDLLIGGSPCQSFSRQGTGDGFDGKSKLFWEFVRVFKEVKPKYFLLENVVMKKEWQDIITEAMGVEPIKINASLVSAQSRPRLFWTNINVDVNSIQDKKLIVKDILDIDAEWIPCTRYLSNFYCHKQRIDCVPLYTTKATCLTATMYKGQIASYCKDENNNVHKYTTVECERLQGVPENYTSVVSNTQRYKMLGNGWNVDVIKYIFDGLNNECKRIL